MVITIKNSFFSLLSICLGIGTYVSIQKYCGDYLKNVLVANCLNADESFEYLHLLNVKGLDAFLCIIVPFFLDAMKEQSGVLLMLIFMPLVSVVFILMLVESSRVGRWPFFAAFIGALGQLFGIGVIFPLFYLPLHFFSSIEEERKTVSLNRYYIGTALFILCTLPTIVIMYSKTHSLVVVSIIIFQFTPSIPGLLCQILPNGIPSGKGESFQAISFLYALFAGVGMIMYWQALIMVLDDHTVLSKILHVFEKSQNAEIFLWIDFVSMLISSHLFIMHDLGLFGLIQFITLSIIFSPAGSLSILCIQRERKSIISVSSVKKTK